MSPTSLLASLVDVLVAPASGEPAALLVQKNRHDAVLLLGGEQLVVLLECVADEPLSDALARRVDAALSAEREAVLLGARQTSAAVILVGGPSLSSPEARAAGALPQVAPTAQVSLWFLRLDPHHATSADLADSGRPLLEDPPLPSTASEEDRATVAKARASFEAPLRVALARIRAGHAPAASREALAASERAGEHALATEGLFARRLDDNYAFSAVVMAALVAVWAAQLVFGWGSDQVLYRMGSAWGHDVARGQWWRLVCAGWLHANLGHLAGNAFGVLLFFGPVAAAIGRRRAFVLFALSCVGGFVAATTFKPDDDGVGASGGIFGLMAALLTLGLRRRGDFLPRSSGAGWAIFAGLYLAFNFFASLKGGVSLLGHLGGALTGALLVLTRAITLGQAPLDGEGPAWGRALTNLALGAVLGVTTWSFAIQWSRQHPWVIRWPHPAVEARVEQTAFGLRVPPSLLEATDRIDEDEVHRLVAGTLRADPLVVSFIVRPRGDDLPDEEPDALVALSARYDRQRHEKPESAHPAAPRIVVEGGARWVLLDESWSDDESRRRRYIRADGDRELDLLVVLDRDANPAWTSAADAVAGSIARLSP